MAPRVFLDANVLLELTLERSSYNETRLLFRRILDGQLTACISSSIVHIAGHWLTKDVGQQRAKEILLTLLNDLQVIEMTHEVTITALESSIRDIEDALQYFTAMHHKADVFISLDAQLKRSAFPSLPVMTVEEFLHAI